MTTNEAQLTEKVALLRGLIRYAHTHSQVEFLKHCDKWEDLLAQAGVIEEAWLKRQGELMGLAASV